MTTCSSHKSTLHCIAAFCLTIAQVFLVLSLGGCDTKSTSLTPATDTRKSEKPLESMATVATVPDEPVLTAQEIERNKLNGFCDTLRHWTDATTVFELAHPDSQSVVEDEYQRAVLVDLYTTFLADERNTSSELVEIEETSYPFIAGRFESAIRPTHMLVSIPATAQVTPKFRANAFWLLAKSNDEWKVVFPSRTAEYSAELERVEMAASSTDGKTDDELNVIAQTIAAELTPELRASVVEWAEADKLVKAYFKLKNETGHDLDMVKRVVDAILSEKSSDEVDANAEADVSDGTPTTEESGEKDG